MLQRSPTDHPPTGKEHLNTIHQQPKYSTQPLSTITLWWISTTKHHLMHQWKSHEPCHNFAKFPQDTQNTHSIAHPWEQAGMLWDVISEFKMWVLFLLCHWYFSCRENIISNKTNVFIFWWNVHNMFCTMWLHGPEHRSNNLLMVDTMISRENSRCSLRQNTSLCCP